MSLSPTHPYQHLEELIRSWAMTQKTVRAIAVIGSQARTVYPADAWSDLDLILVVSDAQPFLEEGAWLDRFGEVWLKVLQTTGPGMPEWLVLYAWRAEETAARNRHPYPAERIARVRTWIELALEEIV